MDKAALNSRAVSSATLKRTRLRSVEARLLARMPTGGQLVSETTVALSENSDGEWVSTISMRLDGYPKDLDRSSFTPELRTFTIEVVAQGAYKWSKAPLKRILQDPETARTLGRPIYLLAASEAQTIAMKLGLAGVKVDVDIPRPDDEGSVPLTSLEQQRLAERLNDKSARDVVPKKTVKRRSARKA